MTAPPLDPAVAGTAAAAALVETEASQLAQIGNRLLTALLQLWHSFGGYYSPDELADFGARAGQLVTAAQAVAGQVAEQHLRLQLRQAGIQLPATRIVRLPDDLRVGARTAEVYQRPAQTVRYLTALAGASSSAPIADAVAAGEGRLRTLADTDLQLARTTASQQMFYEAPESTRFRRIIHPELSAGGTCGLCVVASDRVYGRRELLPLHGGCHCTVLPIVGRRDPGQSINLDDLQRLYAAAGSTKAAALKRTRVQVADHGELGPVLTHKGQQFRDTRDVARDSRAAEEQRRRSLEAQRQALRAQLERGGTPGQLSWLTDRLEVLERELIAS